MPAVIARFRKALPVILILALAITAFVQLSPGIIELDYDPDAAVTELIILCVAAVIFAGTYGHNNLRLELGLALIIYAMAVHLIEEITYEFNTIQILLLAGILIAGLVLITTGVIENRNRQVRMIGHLRVQGSILRERTGELSTMSAALGQANKKLRLLTQITRHDINNRLLAARSFIAFAVMSDDPGTKNSYLEKTDESLEAIGGIIGFTRVYEEIGIARPEWLDVRGLVDAAAEQRHKEGITITNAVDPGLEIYADTLVEKVFYNLIDNALSYGGGKMSTIRFSARPLDGTMIITCEDDGCGVADEEKERIFERGVGKNTGLGLFLSVEILAITGITIRETGIVDTGARFEILVPDGKHRIRQPPRDS